MRALKIALFSRAYWMENRLHSEEEGCATQQLAEAVAALGHKVVVFTQGSSAKKLHKSRIGALETWVFPREKHRVMFTLLRDRWVRKTYSHTHVYYEVYPVVLPQADKGKV